MQTDESQYVHQPVYGLPASLISLDEKVLPVIALMQREAGLNRERRREIQSDARFYGEPDARLRRAVSKTDWSVLTYYLSAGERFGSFWCVVKRLLEPQRRQGAKAFAFAVDVQLLKAYEPGWLTLPFDESTLTAECEEWPRIRSRFERRSGFDQGSTPLGMFMLWPRLIVDLKCWEDLNAGRRLQVGHAIFALSSIGWTDWFVAKAVAFCPEIQPELGALLKASVQATAADERGQTAEELHMGEAEQVASTDARAGSADDPGTSDDQWGQVMQRLDAVAAELREHPTREAVDELSQVALEFVRMRESLPKRLGSVAEEFKERHRDLMVFLAETAERPGFEWLDAATLSQLDARWRLARAERSEPDQIAELGADAAAAFMRTGEASEAFLRAAESAKVSRQLTQAIEQTLVTATGFGQQAAAKRQHVDAQRHTIETEAVQLATQERLIDAASPFAEQFDYSADYVARLDNHEAVIVVGDDVSIVVAPAAPASALAPVETASQAEGLLMPVESDTSDLPEEQLAEGDERLGSSIESAAEVAAFFEQQSLVEDVLESVAALPSDQSADEIRVGCADPYSDHAGEVCRPVWHLLETGQPALAYQTANWIEATHPGTKVPSPDLLAAVALAEELMLPDGPLQVALGSRFENLAPVDFASNTPRSWHAAINLLLAAATLRPMVLAPSSGAATVAAYLHQGGDYPALYALVQKLRSLSSKLMGFRIEPKVLRKARGEAAIRADLQSLQHTAEDWLGVQAPAYTIKFAAATSVWRRWLRPGGKIDALVAPVVHNRLMDADRVRELVAEMSDVDHVTRLIHTTDRREEKRRRGEDIHSGALEHLLRLVDEALKLPRQWLSLVELLGGREDRLRDLLEGVHKALRENFAAVEQELTRLPLHDPWRLVTGGQTQALRSVRGLLALFDSASNLRESEPQQVEVLSRSLLCLPELPIREDWTLEVAPEVALAALGRMQFIPLEPVAALRCRADRGDFLGAEMIVNAGLADADSAPLRPGRERWKHALLKDISECQRAVEVGSAYGYLQEAERGQFESQLARWQGQAEELRRFDIVMAEIRDIRARVEDEREARKTDVRKDLSDIVLTDATRSGTMEVEKALEEGDIATARELVHWLQQGKPTPTDLDEDAREGFDHFFPVAMKEMESWLAEHKRETVQGALEQGQAIPGLDATRVDGARRKQASKMFSAWSDMKGRQEGERSRLELLLIGLGFTVKDLIRADRVSGREIWSLDADPVEDRQVCPLPMYGSSAGGRYRVICVWGRPTVDDLLQWVGDASTLRPALLLFFGRMSEQRWRDLSRLAKSKRRSLMMLDETLLVYLCCSAGSRLRAWFDTAMPFSYSLPYDATAGLVPPEMFYGRGTELDAVRGLNGRCFIYGGRQLGKTALLKRAEQSFHAPSRGHYARWIDLRAEGIGVSVAPGEVWLTLYEKLKELGVLDQKLAARAPGKKQGAEAMIKAIREFLATNADRRVLLLLDEADRFFEQDGRNDFEETRRLKQLMDDSQRRFKVVFAGLHNVLRMTERPNHPLAHFGEPIEVGPLREGEEVREAADLIRRPMAAAGFAFESKGLVIRILAQTNYYPSLIQLYCSQLLRHMLGQVTSRQRTSGPRYLVTDRDIEQVYSSDALRDEIRAKFRLTLQLDPRYEVLAYSMALDLLRGRYTQSDGASWQMIRQTGALHWWADGFRDTSELDFGILLDEMVGLGVLRKLPAGRYVLRNPNVLLLLGTQEEIETVLNKEREPAVEFESTTFRPSLRRASTAPNRNVFTYQQLSRLLQKKNDITIVTGTEAAGIATVAANLEDYLGNGATPVILDACPDRQSFGAKLQEVLIDRPKDQVSVFVIPESVPWSSLWLAEAQDRLKSLRSESKFASLVFVADPMTLWRLLDDDKALEGGELPWMSLLQWSEAFLRHWLEERQIQLDPEDRRLLIGATGLWPALVTDLVGERTELRAVRERIESVARQQTTDTEQTVLLRRQLGLDVVKPVGVIDVLARLCKNNSNEEVEAIEASDLALIAEAKREYVERCLRWGELLGLTRREGAGFWTVDPIVTQVLLGTGG